MELEINSHVCIVIPVYKPFNKISKNEQLSWQQSICVLTSRPFYLACPSTLDITDYIAAANAKGAHCQGVAFDPAYFASVDGYNQLMLSRQFYQRFVQHEYMLLYQLDAFVFRDELAQWSARGFSYIGAPWFKNYIAADDDTGLWAVGNGGFSLRRIADCLRALGTFAVARPWAAVMEDHSPKGSPGFFRRAYLAARYLIIGNNTHWLINDFHRYQPFHQEDYFWGVICPEKFSWYKVPAPQEALAFAFETAPSRMYALQHQQLPMGCHAWEKHEPQFWEPFIAQAAKTAGQQS